MTSETFSLGRLALFILFIVAVLRPFFLLHHVVETRWESHANLKDELDIAMKSRKRSRNDKTSYQLHVKSNNATSCRDPSSLCIQQEAFKISRAYPERTNKDWCLRSSYSFAKGQWRGILLVKVPKGASSTSAGVAIRIGRRNSCQAVEWRHRLAVEYANRTKGSFLFTTIRDPAARAISTIFFHTISRTNVTPTDEVLKRLLRNQNHPHFGAISEGQGGFQLQYTSLATIPKHSAWTPKQGLRDLAMIINYVHHVVSNYDFIIVTERMDESLVAMSLLMGISVGDVLVTASKVAGSRYHLVNSPGQILQCVPTTKSFISPGVQEYLESEDWRAMNYGDYLLHQAANRSLDLTIESLGREKFEAALKEYRRLRAVAEKECATYVKFPCSDDGLPQPNESKKSCYLPFYDFGCGYKCIDQILEQQNREVD